MTIREITAPEIPKINKGFLPHLSTVKMATKVNNTFMIPMVTCPPNAAPKEKPALSRIEGPK